MYVHNDKAIRALADIDPATCAILVIDELGDVDSLPSGAQLKEPTDNTARLLAAARAAGVPVVFANDAHLPGIDREIALWGEHNMAGAPDAQPSPQLAAGPGDYVVEKRRYSAFFQTGLRLLLDELGVTTLVCAGFDTNICVRHTVADAFFNNYATVVVSDATAAFLVGDQDEGLAYMERCYGSVIATTDDVIAVLGR